MNKKIVYFGLVSALVTIPLSVHAAQFRAEEQPSLGTAETIQGNLYMAGGNVSSAGSVRGDLAVAGGNLIVSGPVANDLLAAGGSLTVTSEIGGDARIGGGTITIQGKIAGDTVIGGGQVSIGGAGIGGDVAAAGGTITISAPVSGNVKIAGGEVRIDAPVSGNVDIMAEKITLGTRGVISGNLTYTSRSEATLEKGAVVQGETNFTRREEMRATPAALAAIFSLALLAKILMSFVGALLIYLVFSRYVREVLVNFAAKPLENLGRGFVTCIVLPVASIILLATVIGLPLGALSLLAFIAALIFVSLLAPIVVGSMVHKWIWKSAEFEVNWWIILMGVVIYMLIGFIPLIGWVAKFAIMLATLGVVVMLKWRIAKDWR